MTWMPMCVYDFLIYNTPVPAAESMRKLAMKNDPSVLKNTFPERKPCDYLRVTQQSLTRA